MTGPSKTSLLRRHSIFLGGGAHSKEILFGGPFSPSLWMAPGYFPHASWAAPNFHWHAATQHPATVSWPLQSPASASSFLQTRLQALLPGQPSAYLCAPRDFLWANPYLGHLHVLSSQPSLAPMASTQSSSRSPSPQKVQPLPKAGGLHAASFHSGPT